MDDKSENPETIPENEPIIPENPETVPKKEPIITEKNPEPSPQPKARGRPKGVKDAKPRIKRVPIQQEEVEPLPQVKVKKVEVRPPKREEPPPEEEDEESEEEAPLPPPKSPRTIHRERMHQAATERRQLARDRQDHFERVLDNFMGF
jgi:hypothetical protein